MHVCVRVCASVIDDDINAAVPESSLGTIPLRLMSGSGILMARGLETEKFML